MPEEVRQPVFQERSRPTRVYTENDRDFELTAMQRLAKVRQELAAFPILGVIVPVEQVAAEPEKPKTIGDLLFMLFGALFMKTGEMLESLDHDRKPRPLDGEECHPR